ncbi:hypothetical protein [Pseudomonas sp. PDM13]|uniref:hypothetical protein n=1 Tax=Pseudomonas sp. PDM13 TaxID=2769255 RepID=UPI0021E04A9C|nr:hypothetical protein [Pseudomonas sp. PDM13]MCU9947787.1 hypothetical protein [Pseudomonas sp. PDM13]
MKVCEQCGFLLFEPNRPCQRCAPAADVVLLRPKPSRGMKVLKWLLISMALVVLAGVAAVAWILHSLGPMPSFG